MAWVTGPKGVPLSLVPILTPLISPSGQTQRLVEVMKASSAA